MTASKVNTPVPSMSYEQVKDNFIKECEKLIATKKAVVIVKPLTVNKVTKNTAIQALKFDQMVDLKLVCNGRINSMGLTKKIAILDKVYFSRVGNTHDAIVLHFNKYKVNEILIGSEDWNKQLSNWKLVDEKIVPCEFRKELVELDKVTRTKKEEEEEEEVEIILA